MKTRHILTLSALLAAAPAFANGAFGDGSMWVDLLAERDALAAQASQPRAPLTRADAGSTAGEVSIFEQLAAQHRESVQQRLAGRDAVRPSASATRFAAGSTRGEVSLYEQIAEHQRMARG